MNLNCLSYIYFLHMDLFLIKIPASDLLYDSLFWRKTQETRENPYLGIFSRVSFDITKKEKLANPWKSFSI